MSPFQRLINKYLPDHPHITEEDVKTWCHNWAENQAETIVEPCDDCPYCRPSATGTCYRDSCPDVTFSAMERLKNGDVTHEDLVFEALDELGGGIDIHKEGLLELASIRLDDKLSDIARELLRYILSLIVANGDLNVDVAGYGAFAKVIEGYFDSVGVEDFLHDNCDDNQRDDLLRGFGNFFILNQTVCNYRTIINNIRKS